MRQQFKALNGQRLRFLGTFVRFGEKNGYRGPERTILFTNNWYMSTLFVILVGFVTVIFTHA